MLLLPLRTDGIDVLSVSGPVRAEEVPELVEAVESAWAAGLRGVVVDLREVTCLAEEAVTALSHLAARAKGWPRPSLALVSAAAAELLSGLPVHPDRHEALLHVDDRSSAPRERVELPHGPQGPGRARQAVAAWAERFGMQAISDDLALIVSEMVTNAVRHADAPVHLEVEADGPTLLVAVADGSPHEPQPREADEDAEGGRGLLLVDLLASEHGVRPEPPGKTVWAALTLQEARPRP